MKPSKPSSGALLVRARDLRKEFAGRAAVQGISFDVYEGETVGFLGPNGAGKTTTIRMLLNVLTPTSGELTLFGETFPRARSRILSQMNSSSGTLTLPGKLSVRENLRVFADLYGVASAEKAIRALLERFDLADLAKRPLYALSTDQQVRVALAKAFLNRPRLVLLDEPTASLDPDVADRVRTLLIAVVREQKATVFLTSHNMAEVEKVCSRVLFLKNGSIEAEGTPRELARQIKRWSVVVTADRALHALPNLPLPPNADVRFEGREVHAEMDRHHIGPFLTGLARAGINLENVAIHEPTLEDFFVHSARREAP